MLFSGGGCNGSGRKGNGAGDKAHDFQPKYFA
jgi:hypothetical protein